MYGCISQDLRPQIYRSYWLLPRSLNATPTRQQQRDIIDNYSSPAKPSTFKQHLPHPLTFQKDPDHTGDGACLLIGIISQLMQQTRHVPISRHINADFFLPGFNGSDAQLGTPRADAFTPSGVEK